MRAADVMVVCGVTAGSSSQEAPTSGMLIMYWRGLELFTNISFPAALQFAGNGTTPRASLSRFSRFLQLRSSFVLSCVFTPG
jgi:hypothetical protein